MSPSDPPSLLVASPPGDLPNQVLQTTIRLALALQASVRIVTVVATPASTEPHATAERSRPDDELPMATHIVEKALESALSSLRTAGIPYVVRVRHGSPVQTILAEAAAVQPDFIVMGTRGHSGLRRAVLGSVAEGVIRKADHPVVVVRPVKSS